MDYGIQLGRRFRALKLWMVLRAYGQEKLREILRRHLSLAREFADWIQASDQFELMAPVTFSTVCFRARGKNNEELMNAVNQTGEAYLSHTHARLMTPEVIC